jgi:hypothetical protein
MPTDLIKLSRQLETEIRKAFAARRWRTFNPGQFVAARFGTPEDVRKALFGLTEQRKLKAFATLICPNQHEATFEWDDVTSHLGEECDRCGERWDEQNIHVHFKLEPEWEGELVDENDSKKNWALSPA